MDSVQSSLWVGVRSCPSAVLSMPATDKLILAALHVPDF